MKNPENTKKAVRVSLFDVEPSALPAKMNTEEIADAVRFAFGREADGRGFKISVILTSDKKMAELNKRYLEKEGPTDVLAFPYSSGKMVSADIYVSQESARRQARAYSHTYARELLFIVLHGVLHMLGWNDRSARERKKMWAKQEELIKEFGNARRNAANWNKPVT